MIGTTILLGLPEDIKKWGFVTTSDYLLVFACLVIAAGYVTENYARKTRVFCLPRYGYAHWCRITMTLAALTQLPIVAIACGWELRQQADPMEVLTGGGALLFNMIFLAGVQTILILWKNANVGFTVLVCQQLVGLSVSRLLPGDWKLIFPANWGMYGRSNSITRGGFHMTAVLIIEAVLILALWTVGWRLLRWLIRRSK